MAQAEHVIMQFVVQSAKHHVNPHYFIIREFSYITIYKSHLNSKNSFSLCLKGSNAHAARYRLHSTNTGLQKRMHRQVGKRKIDQLIAKIVENGADLSSDRRNGANPTLDMNGDPVLDQYYNPVTATARGDESAITVIATSHPEYFFFFFLFFIGRRRRTRSRSCVDGRWVKETAKRVVSDGNRERKEG